MTKIQLKKEKKSKPAAAQNIMIYKDGNAHLLDELRWLNRLLSAHVLRLRHINFYEGMKNFRDLFIADEEIDIFLAAGIFENNIKANENNHRKQIETLQLQAQNMREKIDHCMQKSITQNIFLPLVQLKWLFQLSEFELMAMVICLAPQVDVRYEKLYAYVQNDISKKHPSLDLILNLIYPSFEDRLSARDYFSLQAPLFKSNLIEFVENGYTRDAPLLSKHLKVNDRIAGYLSGSRFIDNNLESVAELYFSQKDLSELILPEAIKDHLKKFIHWYREKSTDNRQSIVFSFFGPYGAGKQEVAGAICREIGLPLLVIDLEAILNYELPFKQTFELAFRESLLLPAALYFKNVDPIFGKNEKLRYQKDILLKIVNDNSWLSFISSSQTLDIQGQLSLQRFFQLEFQIPDYAQRQQLWQLHLNGSHPMSNDVDISSLAGKFNFTYGQIQDAISAANNRALWRSPEESLINMKDLYESCRAQSNQKLKILSQKIKPKYVWKDIVLPKDQMAQLREITNYVKYKHVVYDDWGFDRKLSLGKGLNVLFSGPSGTGKTMAAEIMANELNLDLYKIDLSTVVSKYIGETEKNLSKIFKEAETSNAILFFDEADALFGKRSEVKDSHDRYANIEIGYLLQKMDEYTGVVILATNMRKNMDDAFVRRMHFTVEFPFPEENYRLSIWKNIFPDETPQGKNIDFDFLAKKFKMSGGNIKNVALAAAFYAADDERTVTMEHLIRATKREFQKMGKLCVKADFEKYYDLVQIN